MNPTTPRTISIESLQEHLLETLLTVEAGGQELIVTDNGRLAWKIVPLPRIKKGTVEEIFGDLRGQVIIHEDLDTPTIDEWDEV